MGWGIDFKADIFLSKQEYNENPILVQDYIDELSRGLTDIESQVKMFASSNPNDVVSEEWKEEKVRWINGQINDLLLEYREYNILRNNLFLYLEYLNNKKSDE